MEEGKEHFVLYCRSYDQRSPLIQEFTSALEDVFNTPDCYRSRQPTFQFRSNRKQDNYRTYTLSALEMACLLEQGAIPSPGNSTWTNTCGRSECVNTDHWERLPQTHLRASRIDRATSPDDLFPPLWAKPINPRGHARLGTRNHRATISDEVASVVLKRRYCHGEAYRHIAEQLGLKQAAVLSICVGRSHRTLAQKLLPELIAGARRNGILPPEPTPEPPACAVAI
jgi:hypothetical protein